MKLLIITILLSSACFSQWIPEEYELNCRATNIDDYSTSMGIDYWFNIVVLKSDSDNKDKTYIAKYFTKTTHELTYKERFRRSGEIVKIAQTSDVLLEALGDILKTRERVPGYLYPQDSVEIPNITPKAFCTRTTLLAEVINFSNSYFQESHLNDGSLKGQLIVNTSSQIKFNGHIGEDFFESRKVSVWNVPAGLTPQVILDQTNKLVLSFKGRSDQHTNSNDVSNVTIILEESAFEDPSVTDSLELQKTDITIDFNDPGAFISFSNDRFQEDRILNDGSISDNLFISVSGTTIKNLSDSEIRQMLKISNIPSGLNLVVKRYSSSLLVISFTGKADHHRSIDTLKNMIIEVSKDILVDSTYLDEATLTLDRILVNFHD